MSTPWSYLRIVVTSIVCLAGVHLVAGPAMAQNGTLDRPAASARFASLRDGDARAAALHREVAFELRAASLQAALEEITRQAGLSLVVHSRLVPPAHEVTVGAGPMAAGVALARALDGTDLDLLVSPDGEAVLVERVQPEPTAPAEPPQPRPPAATITGRVTDALTGSAVSGATVALEGTAFGAVSGNTGRYRITGVPAGEYTVVASQLAYAEARQSVTLADGEEATIDFELDVAAVALDQVVVTGTAFETPIRTVPNPINVITARDIEAKGATTIGDLLRGEVPGVMSLSGGQEDYYSYIYVRGNAAGGSNLDVIKVYVDGIQAAHPLYLSTIDPKSIERIEVIRGPQASAIYGLDAASGVLQIFTKKGTPGGDRPRLDFKASAGVVESDYVPDGAGTPLTQDYSLGVTGGTEAFSYRVGASHVAVGEWVKNYGSRTTSVSGGLRTVQGPLTLELTANASERGYDLAQTPIFLRFPTSDACPQCGNPDYRLNWDHTLTQHTTGLTLGYRATPSWRHTLTLGQDENRYAFHQPEPAYNTPVDTLVRLVHRELRRRSLRYHTAYDAALGSAFTARITAGLDLWSFDVKGSSASSLLSAFGTVQTTPSTFVSLFNDRATNAGYFGMAEIGLRDQLFLTFAGRLEDQETFGEEFGRAFTPRFGAAYVRPLDALGGAELKLRAQYGQGVRPPPGDAATGATYGSIIYEPNPEIRPEEKVGWDAGAELHWGERVSLALTRYEEEARNLIEAVPVDLAGTPPVHRWQNIGRVRAEGWELESSVTFGRVTIQANYAYSDNTVQEVTEQVASDPDASLKVGDRTLFAPKHSGGASASLRLGPGRAVSVDASMMAGWRALDYIAYYGYEYAGEPFRGSIRDYYIEYPALWKWNLRVDHAVTDRVTTFLRVDNLLDDQSVDMANYSVGRGRTTVIGIGFTP